jgi:hypothetical protein
MHADNLVYDNENGFARAFGGDSGTCVCRGKVTSRLSPCFAVELRILLSSIFGEKNPLGFPIFGQLVRLFLSQAVVWGEGSLFQRTNVYRTIVKRIIAE